jgi:hypothetical protein
MNPTEILPIVFIVVLLALAVVIVMVGVQLFLTLKTVRQTLKDTDELVKNVDKKVGMLQVPLSTLSNLALGLSSGLRAFESFGGWLTTHKKAAK